MSANEFIRFGAPARFDARNVQRGMQASRTGEVISLNLELADPVAPYGRTPFRRTMRVHNDFRPLDDGRYMIVNDDEISVALQGTSHWDSFGHFGLSSPETDAVYHGGHTLRETYPHSSSPNLGIQALGPGVVTRGVLLDPAALFADEATGYLEGDFIITRDILEQCISAQGVTIEAGDAVLIHTGFQRRRAALGGEFPKLTAGLDGSSVELWRQLDILALIADNPAVEATPNDHAVHIGILLEAGIPLGEFWALDELAQACRSDGHYDFTLVSVPLNIHGAFGSPANAIAIR